MALVGANSFAMQVEDLPRKHPWGSYAALGE